MRTDAGCRDCAGGRRLGPAPLRACAKASSDGALNAAPPGEPGGDDVALRALYSRLGGVLETRGEVGNDGRLCQ